MVEPRQEPGRRSVFISYGRADALDFARRLASDLEKRGGYQVWMDLENIEKGGLFEVRIEQGIRAASVVAAVMTRHSLREESVCRDEVVFALNEGKPIVPIRADPDPNLRPTLLLCRRNWLDFTQGYEEALDALLKYLAGDVTVLHPPLLPNVTGVVPLDFGPEIARFSGGFTGREWLSRELDEWLATPGGRALVIVGEPGIGKSSIAAWLSQTREDQVVGIHFCTRRNTRTLDPFEFVASVVGQLSTQLAGYEDVVSARHPEIRRPKASDTFRELVVEPARSLPPRARPVLLIVDSLDEAATQSSETVVDVLTNQALDLPEWMRIVTTTRPETRILQRIRRLSPFELRADRPDNLADLSEYVLDRLHRTELAHNSASLGRELECLADGNFLYARMVLDALENGAMRTEDLGRLTPGLADYYHSIFSTLFTDLDGYAWAYLPLLKALAVALEPVPFSVLQRMSNASPEELNRRLRAVSAFLSISGEGSTSEYTLFHKSLQDWLTDRNASGDYWCEPASGHVLLAEVLCDIWRDCGYALRNLPAHLVEAKRWDVLVRVLSDWDYVEARVSAGTTYGLIRDYRHAQSAAVASGVNVGDDSAFRNWQGLISERPHRLAPLREPFLQVACNRASAGPVAAEARRRAAAYRGPWLRLINQPSHQDSLACLMVLEGHTSLVLAAAFSSDGRHVLSGSDDNTLILWDVGTGEPLRTFTGHAGRVSAVAFSPDGRRALSASADMTLALWDVGTGEPLRTFKGHAGPVTAVVFSPDGRHALSGSLDHTLILWDVGTGKPLRTFTGHTNWVRAVAFSPDGRNALSGSWDRTLILWDVGSGESVRTFGGHADSVHAVAFSPDGRHVLSGSDDNTLILWDACSSRPVRTFKGHADAVHAATFSPDGRHALSGSLDNTLILWDVETGEPLRTFKGHTRSVNAVAFSPDGQHAVSGSWDKTLILWNVGSSEPLRTIKGHTDSVHTVTFSPDGRLALSGSFDNTLILWDAGSGEPLRTLKGHTDKVRAVAFSPDGRQALSGSNRALILWDIDSDEPLRTFEGHTPLVNAVAFSPDGRHALSGSDDNTLVLWDARSGGPLRTFKGHTGLVSAVAFSPDGRHALSGSHDQIMILWDIVSGEPLRTFRGHTDWVHPVAFSPDGRQAMSGSWDKTLILWDVGTGEPLRAFKGHTSPVRAVAFSPDARQAMSGSWDKTLLLWEVGTGDVALRLTAISEVQCLDWRGDSIVIGLSNGEVQFYRITGIDHRLSSGESKSPGSPDTTSHRRIETS
jgi:WD40 repeat protein